MRTRLLASLGAAALIAGGLVVTEASPAWASGSCNQTALAAKTIASQGVIAAEIPASAQNLDGLTCSLSQGNTGAGVIRLQQDLRECYGATIAADGQFGPATKAALQSAQSAEGISADGQYGPQTRGALKWKTYDGTLCNRLYSPLTYLGPVGGSTALGNAIVARAQVELADTTRNFEWANDPANNYHGSTNCTFYAGAEGASWPLCRPGTSWRGGTSANDSTYAWCALFVRYVWRNSGASIAYTDGYAASFRTQGQNLGTYHLKGGYTPKPGDAVVFDENGDGVIDHVGIVTGVSGSDFFTIEGNSSNMTRARTHGLSDASVVGYTTPTNA